MTSVLNGRHRLVMLSKSRVSIRNLQRGHAEIVCRSDLRTASFTTTIQRLQGQTSSQNREALAPKEQGNGSNDKRSNASSRRRFPALALFALGLPVGWYLSDYWQKSNASTATDPTQFVRYMITSKENVSSTCAIFTLKPAGVRVIAAAEPDTEWAISSVEFKQPQLQIARSYTCLPSDVNQDPHALRFLIRKERGGEVSNFLHRLPVGAEVEVRGPHIEYAIPNDVRSAIFLAAGTGIAPALQAADVLDGEADMHILWCNRRREDCIGGLSDTPSHASSWSWWPRSSKNAVEDTGGAVSTLALEKGAIVTQLECLKASFAASPAGQPRLTVDFFVDEEGALLDQARVRACITRQSRSYSDEHRQRRVIFVSGPAGFINHWAGSKQWVDGREVQGPIGGVLSTMDLKDWSVVKL